MAIINSNFRLTGIASGLDTDQIVKDLMAVERLPLTKLEQQKQLAQWRQEDYRDFTNTLRAFKEQFFDVTKRTSYLLSDNAFMVYSARSSSEEYVTARGTALAEAASHKIKVVQLATADKAVSNGAISKPITGSGVSEFNLSGKTMNITLDGVTREIALSNYHGSDEHTDADRMVLMVEDLQQKLNDAFGVTGSEANQGAKIVVSNSGNQISFATANGATKLALNSGMDDDGLASLGISSGSTNRISVNSKLSDLVDKLQGNLTFIGGEVSFTINEETFTFSQDDTLTKVMETINNNAKANVRMRYDETTDQFSITAKQTGAGDNIRIAETAGTFFAGIGIDSAAPVSEQGVDAIAVIDNVTVARSTNTFTVNGLEYTLKNVHEENSVGETISVEQNVDAVFNSIKSFVDEYNKLIDKFSSKLTEKYDKDYYPLSSDEKNALSEDEVEKWEKSAKTGLLRNDPILSKIQSDMRMALLESVEGVGINLSSIGISSRSYVDKGKLYIDEDKLKAAIREKPDEVRNLFKQRSESVPAYQRDLTHEQRATRYKEQGLLYRISDILDDNISILRDKDGRKGILLEKAGMQGDSSEFNSIISKDISAYDKRISEFLDKLITKEENYYRQFSRLETYMNQMNSQMNWLTQQLSSL